MLKKLFDLLVTRTTFFLWAFMAYMIFLNQDIKFVAFSTCLVALIFGIVQGFNKETRPDGLSSFLGTLAIMVMVYQPLSSDMTVSLIFGSLFIVAILIGLVMSREIGNKDHESLRWAIVFVLTRAVTAGLGFWVILKFFA